MVAGSRMSYFRQKGKACDHMSLRALFNLKRIKVDERSFEKHLAFWSENINHLESSSFIFDSVLSNDEELTYAQTVGWFVVERVIRANSERIRYLYILSAAFSKQYIENTPSYPH
ncbi:hypothetical protein H2248_010311 [Termitomyces sp. 'cryptogamus']|nr:hypothetical protein H2248_010311 [Termitomyces sp. 'cryptogamus']